MNFFIASVLAEIVTSVSDLYQPEDSWTSVSLCTGTVAVLSREQSCDVCALRQLLLERKVVLWRHNVCAFPHQVRYARSHGLRIYRVTERFREGWSVRQGVVEPKTEIPSSSRAVLVVEDCWTWIFSYLDWWTHLVGRCVCRTLRFVCDGSSVWLEFMWKRGCISCYSPLNTPYRNVLSVLCPRRSLGLSVHWNGRTVEMCVSLKALPPFIPWTPLPLSSAVRLEYVDAEGVRNVVVKEPTKSQPLLHPLFLLVEEGHETEAILFLRNHLYTAPPGQCITVPSEKCARQLLRMLFLTPQNLPPTTLCAIDVTYLSDKNTHEVAHGEYTAPWLSRLHVTFEGGLNRDLAMQAFPQVLQRAPRLHYCM